MKRYSTAIGAFLLVTGALLSFGLGVAGSQPLQDDASPAGGNDDILESIRTNQVAFVEKVCSTSEELSEVDVKLAEASGDPGVVAQAVAQQSEQRSKCDVAIEATKRKTSEDFRPLGLLRQSEAARVAEYVGDDKDTQTDPPEPDPVWEPGGDTLEDRHYLGSEYTDDGDNDGVCNTKKELKEPDVAAAAAKSKHGSRIKGYDEWCAEVVGDGIGDDDGFCEIQDPKGPDKAFEETCVTLATSISDIEADDNNIDTEALEDYDEVLKLSVVEAEMARRDVEALNNEVKVLAAFSPLEFCTGEVQEEIETWRLTAVWALASSSAGLQDAASNLADNTVAGFDASAVAAVGAIANGVTQGLTNTLEVKADAEVASNVANTYRCVDSLGTLSKTILREVKSLKTASLNVVELKEKETYLIDATISGRPAEWLQWTNVAASPASPPEFQPLEPFTQWNITTTGTPGVYLLSLSLPTGLRNADLFLIDAKRGTGEDTVYGHVIVDRRGGNG